MYKRIAIILFAAVLLLASSPVVYADVVMSNEFLYENADKVESLGNYGHRKLFVVNHPSGYVIPKKEPGSKDGIPTNLGYRGGWGNSPEDLERAENDYFIFMNGEIIDIEAVYLHKGNYWGIMSPSHIYQPPGWVLMSELLVLYQQEDWEKENEEHFYTYTGSYDAILSAEKLVEWQWPGSDREKQIIYIEDLYRNDTFIDYANFLYAYTDVEGREWGKADYFHGWFCLNDVGNNSNIPSFSPAKKPIKWSHDGIYDWSSGGTAVWPPAAPSNLPLAKPFNVPVLIIIVSFVLVAVVVVWVMVFRRKNKSKQGGSR
jgi:hypothetical protein